MKNNQLSRPLSVAVLRVRRGRVVEYEGSATSHMPHTCEAKLKILHLVLAIGATNTTYNEHCLPVADKRDLAICAYFPSDIVPPRAIAYFAGNGALMGFFRALRAALDANEYDVIHAHSPHVAVLFLAAALLRHRAYLPKTVVTVHDSYEDFKLRNRLLFLPVFAMFRKVVCCSEASYASFPALFRGLAGRRLGFVQNGVDLARIDRVASAARPGAPDGSFTVMAVSRLVDVKNPACAVAAFRKSAGATARLQYIGDGPLRAALIAETRTEGLANRVEFTGLAPRETVFAHLLNADLFLSTSRGEGLPIAVLEAMACRLPVVLSDIPPHREIAHGVDFIPLVDPDDVEGFAREIRRYQEMPVPERWAIGRRCRRLVEDRFSLDAMHAGYQRVYNQVMDAARPRSPRMALHDC